jgi:hypothetical protein
LATMKSCVATREVSSCSLLRRAQPNRCSLDATLYPLHKIP